MIDSMMNFIKKYKYFIIAAVVVIAALVIAFISGGNVEQAKQERNAAVTQNAATADSVEQATYRTESVTQTFGESTYPTNHQTATSSTVAASREPDASENIEHQTTNSEPASRESANLQSNNQKASQTPKTQDKYKTDPTPTDKPQPVEPQERKITNKRQRCTISVSCTTVFSNQDKIDETILAVQPADGWIIKPTTITINEGESVFEVLQKVCKRKSILMEFSDTPMYNSAYIEGINNLYEFDCGSGSGWMYKVNDWYPNYGCSRYAVQNGDVIEWVYTCNMGYDIGGGNQYN